jgi:hypothetical protein
MCPGEQVSAWQIAFPSVLILRLKRDEAIGEWRKLQNGELHNLHSSPDIIRQIKSRRMRWAGHVARRGEGRNVYRVLVVKPEGRNHLKD